MSPSNELYTSDYHKKIEIEESPQAERLAQWITDVCQLDQLAKVTDFGCSTGIYIRALRARGILASGVENSRAALDNKVCEHVEMGDITTHCEIRWACDGGLCIEVAEHIDPASSDDVIRCLVRHTRKWLIFSAAVPGQGGVGHINCQPKDYWIEKFEKRGWVVDHIKTLSLLKFMGAGYHLGWFIQNAMFLRPLRRS
jgi:hypothetical protein